MQLVSPQNFKDVPEVSHVFGHHLTLYYHVIYVGFNALPQLRLKHFGCHSLIGGPRVFQTKRHHLLMVVSNGSDKSYLFLVICGQWYLMISLKGIQEAHPGMACGCVYQLIYLRHREQIFWAGFIQIYEVYTNSPFPALLLYHYSIGQPLGIKNFLDSSCFFELHHLVPNSVGMLL